MRKLANRELNRASLEDFKLKEKNKIILVLDNVRSLNNVGSIFRTADAFSIECIYLCGISATPPHKEIHKTALGAENSVEWKYFETTQDAVIELRNEKYTICAVEQTEMANPLQEFGHSSNEKIALIFGNEVDGVSQEIVSQSDSIVEIPQWGTKHSLNVAVSVGIVLWELIR